MSSASPLSPSFVSICCKFLVILSKSSFFFRFSDLGGVVVFKSLALVRESGADDKARFADDLAGTTDGGACDTGFAGILSFAVAGFAAAGFAGDGGSPVRNLILHFSSQVRKDSA